MKKQIQELLDQLHNFRVGLRVSALPRQIRTRDIQEAEMLGFVKVDRDGKTCRSWFVTCTSKGREEHAEIMKAKRDARAAKRKADMEALGPCPLCGKIAVLALDGDCVECSDYRCELASVALPRFAWIALSKKVVHTCYRNF